MAFKNASSSSRTYHWQEEVESLEQYGIGGYHPVCNGDEFSDCRYEIVHKLGFGSYSTIWLARDNQKRKYVALKFSISAITKTSTETRILQYLNRAGQDLPSAGKIQIPALLDQFMIQGPNGQHQCLVSEPSGCSLSLSKYGSRTGLFPLEAARAMAAQLILGVRYLHSCGVVHGDLHLGNILFRMPTLDALSVDNLYQKYGEPRRQLIKRLDDTPVICEAPPYAVIPVWLGIDCEEVNTENAVVQLCDFGEAYMPDRENRYVTHVPSLLRPPEANFPNHLVGFPSDIWTLACTLYEILGERPLFEGLAVDADDVLAENISAIGKLPPEWWEVWKQRGDFFTSEGEWKEDTERVHEPRFRPIAERVDCMGRDGEDGFSEKERAAITDMLTQMLVFRPENRIAAEELARITWMENWGIPALAKIRNL